MPAGQFLRAYGNRWTRTAEQVIPATAWAGCQGTLERPGAVALAFAVALDRRDACIAAAWRDVEHGPVRVDVIDHRPGTSWLVDRITDLEQRWQLVAPVGYDGIGPAGYVADELRRRGVKLEATTTADYTAACAGLLADVTDNNLTHPGAASLDAAVAAAGKRPIGDRWVWGRQQSDGCIAPLEAVTIARWAFDHRPARRKPVVRSAKAAA